MVAKGGVFSKSENSNQEPFVVVHPIGYDGNGGELKIAVCASSSTLVPAVLEAIDLWNNLTPTIENCSNCKVEEDAKNNDLTVPFHLSSAVAHELGHCAMGLGHSNWGFTSYTNSRDASSFNGGSDLVIGSKDDTPSPLPGTRLIHWFRIFDNNPIVIDGMTIDGSTYSRRILDLSSSGSDWPANGNKYVAQLLGAENTQSLMYTSLDRGMRYSGLIADDVNADDVNTVRLGMSGMDLVAGTTDDYTAMLEYVANCSNADVEVQFDEISSDDDLGFCLSEIEQIDDTNIVHYRIKPFIGNPRPLVVLDTDTLWDTVFADGFESGTFSSWSSVSP